MVNLKWMFAVVVVMDLSHMELIIAQIAGLKSAVQEGKIMKCVKCGKELEDFEGYEYRGAFSCDEHFDEVIEMRDFERSEVIKEQDSLLKPLKGLDISPDSMIGKANRKLLKSSIEISSKETARMRNYEGR